MIMDATILAYIAGFLDDDGSIFPHNLLAPVETDPIMGESRP